MSKFNYEEKREIYNKRKEGETLKTLQSKYGMTKHNIQYLVWLIDKHGFDILRTTKSLNWQFRIRNQQTLYLCRGFINTW